MGNFNRNNRSGSRGDFGQRDFGRRSFSDYGGRREMHKAVCSNCGKNCEVPFEPTGSKPVYCNECFKKNGGGRPNFERRNESRSQNNEQFEIINRKLDKILGMLTVTPAKGEKKTKTPKKKTPVTKE
jgi:CxxC-x17-CxxC domain-containing protein